MSTTRHVHGPAAHRATAAPPRRSARIGSWTWADPVVRAWVFVALIPGFAVLAFFAAAGTYTLLGYEVGVENAPLWADRLTGLAAFATLAVPCALAVRYGNQARRGADRRGITPMSIGLIVGVWWLSAGVFALAQTF